MDVFQQLAELRHAQRRMKDQLDVVQDCVQRCERVLGLIEERQEIDLCEMRVMPVDMLESEVAHEAN